MAASIVGVMIITYLLRVTYNHFTDDPTPWTGSAFTTPLLFGAAAALATWLGHPARHPVPDEGATGAERR